MEMVVWITEKEEEDRSQDVDTIGPDADILVTQDTETLVEDEAPCCWGGAEDGE